MKSTSKHLLALPLAILIMAFGVLSTPSVTRADNDEASVSDNQFLDGNWFQIAADKGEAYTEGSPTNVALEKQLDAYQTAVENRDLANEERLAIRSWVKGWVAAEIGRSALEAGNYSEAKTALKRAIKYGKAAQKPGAGKGEKHACGGDGGRFQRCSAEEGADVVTYAQGYLDKAVAKAGASSDSDNE